MKDDEIRPLLVSLVHATLSIVKSELEKNSIEPEYETYERWTVESFDYDDTGCHYRRSGTHFNKPFWSFTAVKIARIVENTKEYRSLMDLPKEQGIDSFILSQFFTRLITEYLENGNISEDRIDEYIKILISDLLNEPVNCSAVVQLSGIIVHPQEFEIQTGISLRKPRKEDFEIEIPIYHHSNPNIYHRPTAFLTVSIRTKEQREIQEEIEKAITILRLFKPGSIKWDSYTLRYDSFSKFFGGTYSSADILSPQDNIILQEGMIDSLRIFWRHISPILPSMFYKFGTGPSDYRLIAYQRYSDALLHNGIIEQRIASAIMGLEALYLKPKGERQELQHRLKMRVARVLNFLDCNPKEVTIAIKDAYEIRSIFSHGGNLSENDIRKFKARYEGNIQNLLVTILDYLRSSIIIALTIQSNKESFLDSIDDAMISDLSKQQLNNDLQPGLLILKFEES